MNWQWIDDNKLKKRERCSCNTTALWYIYIWKDSLCVLLHRFIRLAYLSARIFRCGTPKPQLLTIHAVSKAAKNPRAIPVPRGQKGCGTEHKKWLWHLKTTLAINQASRADGFHTASDYRRYESHESRRRWGTTQLRGSTKLPVLAQGDRRLRTKRPCVKHGAALSSRRTSEPKWIRHWRACVWQTVVGFLMMMWPWYCASSCESAGTSVLSWRQILACTREQWGFLVRLIQLTGWYKTPSWM